MDSTTKPPLLIPNPNSTSKKADIESLIASLSLGSRKKSNASPVPAGGGGTEGRKSDLPLAPPKAHTNPEKPHRRLTAMEDVVTMAMATLKEKPPAAATSISRGRRRLGSYRGEGSFAMID
jgi:hypothetical protein